MSASDPLAQRMRVHVDVEELRPELADDGEVDAVLELGERIVARTRRGEPDGAVERRSWSSISLPPREAQAAALVERSPAAPDGGTKL